MSPEPGRTPLIVIGAAGTCLDIAEAALLSGDFTVLGFLDDGFEAGFMTALDLPVLGPLARAAEFPEAVFINGVGGPASFRDKARIIGGLNLEPRRFARVIHPSACLSRTARVGRGVAILAHCDLGAGVLVGDQVVMLPQTVIGHETTVESGVILGAGVKISGRVRLGAGSYLGSGAVVRQDCQVGAGCLVGAGSAVVSDLPPHTLCYGVPAKVRKVFA